MRRILGSAGRASEEGGVPVASGDRTDNAVRMVEAIHGYIAVCNTGDAEAIAAFFARRRDYFPHLVHCPQAQRLQRLVIQLAAVVFTHDPIIPDHKIKVDLLMKSLVTSEITDPADTFYQVITIRSQRQRVRYIPVRTRGIRVVRGTEAGLITTCELHFCGLYRASVGGCNVYQHNAGITGRPDSAGKTLNLAAVIRVNDPARVEYRDRLLVVMVIYTGKVSIKHAGDRCRGRIPRQILADTDRPDGGWLGDCGWLGGCGPPRSCR